MPVLPEDDGRTAFALGCPPEASRDGSSLSGSCSIRAASASRSRCAFTRSVLRSTIECLRSPTWSGAWVAPIRRGGLGRALASRNAWWARSVHRLHRKSPPVELANLEPPAELPPQHWHTRPSSAPGSSTCHSLMCTPGYIGSCSGQSSQGQIEISAYCWILGQWYRRIFSPVKRLKLLTTKSHMSRPATSSFG